MKFINPSVELWQPKSYSIEDGLRHAERCGRICYLSEDRITEDSYKKFCDNLIKNGHLSVLEHCTIYLVLPIGSPVYDKYYIRKHDLIEFFSKNPYSIARSSLTYEIVDAAPDEYKDFVAHCGPTNIWYVTTNYRVLIENDLTEKILPYVVNQPKDIHEKRYTFHVITDIGVTREMNRHHTFSISEQSTRYCDFTKDKFNGELTFIRPAWWQDIMVKDNNIERYKFGCQDLEYVYKNLRKFGWKPEQARQILPLGLKTEAVYTAFERDWKHFLKLRTVNNAHPNIRVIANKIKDIMEFDA